MSDSKLEEYKNKRDFPSPGEPSGEGESNMAQSPMFVIQKHDASSLHYDFRIEVDGVFKSWAVPKGPSTDPREKRLAMPTEDHSLEYGDFEGVIPENQYGGGTVLIWDRGTYENLKKDDDGQPILMAQCLEEGHATIFLKGEKIAGGYALIRTDEGKNERWLLVKVDDDQADARRNPVSTEPLSVVSGRDLQRIAEEEQK
jgi:DNA ligase D-like protein (predicted 3'-phosphoesterase)